LQPSVNSQGAWALQVGICKIIPPKGWKPCKGDMESREFTLKRPMEQTLTGKQGFFQALQLERKRMSLQEEYAPLAKDSQNQPKNGDVEREFWRSNHLQAPIYGADCEATLCDSGTKVGPVLPLTPSPQIRTLFLIGTRLL
jgi:jumonji domain-containing protein 2